MTQPATSPLAPGAASPCCVRVLWDEALLERATAWSQSGIHAAPENPSLDGRWLRVLADGLGHRPCGVVATDGERPVGLLPLAHITSLMFGSHLVGLPYLSSGGVLAESPHIAGQIVDAAVELASELGVRHLQLRHETPVAHPALVDGLRTKVHLRLALPPQSETLWKSLDAKVRNQVRKAEKQSFTIHWGQASLMPDFYTVFSRNMRDLGTPVFPARFFRAMLRHLPECCELCVVREGTIPVAAGIVVHGQGMTQVLSASSLRAFNARCPNMLLYWQLLQRSIERGQTVFDFGRSTADSNTFRFKAQWGAQPHPTAWQFFLRRGTAGDLRPEQSGFRLATRVWRRLPLWVANRVGPLVIRGIPT